MTVIAVTAYSRRYALPWTPLPGERERLRRIMTLVLAITLLLSFLVPFLPLPERRIDAVEDVPPRLARLLLERAAPPPAPPPPRSEPAPVDAPSIAEPLPERKFRERRAEPPGAQPDARARASTAGLLPFQNQLAALRDHAAAGKAVDSGRLTGAVGETMRAERSMITSGLSSLSGGIDTSNLSRGYGGGVGSLTGPAMTQVAASSQGSAGTASAGDRRGPAGGRPSRSREEIELVFDRNKSAIHALYSRALRSNPTLQGKLVLELTIAPSGEVTACRIISSELDDAELERKLIARVRMFRFEERDVEPVTTTKPIDFFPA